MTPELIVAKTDRFALSDYSLILSRGDLSEVRLQEIDILGRARWQPALKVGDELGKLAEIDTLNWNAIRAENARAQVRGVNAATRLLASVVRDGLQRVTHSELLAHGLDLTGVNASNIAILDAGIGQARFIDCAVFGAGCQIEWLGRARVSLYGPANVYEIKVSLGQAIAVQAAHGAASITTREHIIVRKDEANKAYSFSAPGNDPWYEQRLVAQAQPVSFERPFDLPDLVGSSAEITVHYFGGSNYADVEDHDVALSVNGVVLDRFQFDGLTAVQRMVTVRNARASGNMLEFKVMGGHAPASVVMFDHLFARYARNSESARDLRVGDFTAYQNSETLFANGYEASETVRVAGVTEPTLIWAKTKHGTRRYSANGPIGIADYQDIWVQSVASVQTPPLSAAPAAFDPHAADYLIIAHPLFIDQLQPLIQLQTQRGLSVRVLSTAQAFAAHSDHASDPEAIRTVARAHAQSGGRYLLLVGGDSYDTHNYLGLGSQSYLPTFYRRLDPIVAFGVTDHRFANVDDDSVVELAVGRLPVRTASELARTIGAIVARAAAPSRNWLGISGASQEFESFAQESRVMLSALPSSAQLRFASVEEQGVSAVRNLAINALAGDADWVNYLGHSAPSRWGIESLLNTSDLNLMQHQGAPAIVAQWGCWNNYFVLPDQNTMSHALTLRPNTIAAAVLGATSLAENASHQALAVRFFTRLGTASTPGQATLGLLLQAAKNDLLMDESAHIDAVWTITLFGDPAHPAQ